VGNGDRHRLLDGPQIAAALRGSQNPLVKALAEREARMYRRFRLPDVLVVLLVTPAVAVARKPDHDLEVLRAKSGAVLELAGLAESCGAPVRVVRVDADRPWEIVLADVKTRLWDVL
jgi:hypothetical protein